MDFFKSNKLKSNAIFKKSNSIILPNAIIGRNCTISKAIVNEGVVVDDRTEIGDADGKIVVYGTSKLSV